MNVVEQTQVFVYLIFIYIKDERAIAEQKI